MMSQILTDITYSLIFSTQKLYFIQKQLLLELRSPKLAAKQMFLGASLCQIQIIGPDYSATTTNRCLG